MGRTGDGPSLAGLGRTARKRSGGRRWTWTRCSGICARRASRCVVPWADYSRQPLDAADAHHSPGDYRSTSGCRTTPACTSASTSTPSVRRSSTCCPRPLPPADPSPSRRAPRRRSTPPTRPSGRRPSCSCTCPTSGQRTSRPRLISPSTPSARSPRSSSSSAAGSARGREAGLGGWGGGEAGGHSWAVLLDHRGCSTEGPAGAGRQTMAQRARRPICSVRSPCLLSLLDEAQVLSLSLLPSPNSCGREGREWYREGGGGREGARWWLGCCATKFGARYRRLDRSGLGSARSCPAMATRPGRPTKGQSRQRPTVVPSCPSLTTFFSPLRCWREGERAGQEGTQLTGARSPLH